MRHTHSARLLVATGVVLVLSIGVTAQRGGPGGPGGAPGGGNNPIATLKGVAVPQPDLSQYVADRQLLVALGKALFWDQQVGSDGRTACASCHFHAGADHRLTNQIAGVTTATGTVRTNTTLTAADFPFHAFSDPNTNQSAVIRDRRAVVGSAGVVLKRFAGLADGSAESAAEAPASAFTLGGLNVRQVTSRNAPTVINAVYNFRNFWDGRASNIFNASTPFGAADARANVLVNGAAGLNPASIRIDRSSLASQAVGPPLNGLEMSYDGRAWADLGRKMLALTPLGRQTVSRNDSVLGPLASAAGTGLRSDATYAELIKASFQPAYWNSRAVVDANGRVIVADGEPGRSGEFNQMAYNFGLFFGIAVQAYEATLISDDTPVDRFLAGDTAALSGAQQQGLNEFRNGGSQCTQCHMGPELTAAGITSAANGNPADPRAVGFFRTAVSAIEDDPGAAGVTALGTPIFPGAPGGRGNGAFKASSLRNVELTGPYFHTGGAATLEQVLEFYARNGDVPAGGNLSNGFGNINLNAQDRARLLDFLKALTDDRVKFERAPFDHPSLCVPVGYQGAADAELFALVPSVGTNGNAVPLQTFAEQLAGIGRDGSRAHTLQQSCVP